MLKNTGSIFPGQPAVCCVHGSSAVTAVPAAGRVLRIKGQCVSFPNVPLITLPFLVVAYWWCLCCFYFGGEFLFSSLSPKNHISQRFLRASLRPGQPPGGWSWRRVGLQMQGEGVAKPRRRETVAVESSSSGVGVEAAAETQRSPAWSQTKRWNSVAFL